MVSDILDGICLALKGIFPGNVKVYTEQVKQGLKLPCFMVTCVDSSSGVFIGKKYLKDYLFTVQYLPGSTTDERSECYGVAERLFPALRYVATVDGLIMGKNLKWEYSGGMLSFFVKYSGFIVVGSDDDIKMEELEPRETEVRA